MIEIPLTNSDKVALIDDEDYERVSQYKWFLNEEYVFSTNRKDRKKLHRFIINNYDKTVVVDHINHNKLDNRKCNLRVCSVKENTRNHKKYGFKTATSKYIGVHWDKEHKKWRACITSNYKVMALGRFDSELEAAKAYNEAALKYFGEYANVNNIPEGLKE